MEYMTTQQAAEKWGGVSMRWVQAYLKHGRIEGAMQFGRDWMIPKEAAKPSDGRKNNGRKRAASVSSNENS